MSQTQKIDLKKFLKKPKGNLQDFIDHHKFRWKPRGGVPTPLSEINTVHLTNIINYLYKIRVNAVYKELIDHDLEYLERERRSRRRKIIVKPLEL